MRWLFALLAIFAALVCGDQADANVFLAVRASVAASTCPFPTGATDGCLAANTLGSVRFANGAQPGDYLNQITATTTNYLVQQPTWNKAGIDYPVSTLIGTALLDPTISAIAGCQYFSTGVIQAGVVFTVGGGPAMNCNTSSGFIGFTGYTFEAQNGHGCIALRIVGSGSPTMNISNSRLKNDGNCALKGNPNLLTGGVATGTLNLTNVEFDGNALTFRDFYGSCTFGGSVACSATQAFNLTGCVNIEYSYFHDFSARPFLYSASNTSCGLSLKHSLFAGADYSDPQSHAEWIIYGGNPGGTGTVNQYNTWIQTTSGLAVGLAPFPSQFVTVNQVPTFTIDHNFYIAGFAGGATQTATVAGTFSGSTFTASTVSGGTIGTGELVTCGSLQFTLVNDGTTLHKTPAGIGGGAHGTTGATWYGDIFSSTITGKIDNGSGASGNILTVTADTGAAIDVGTTVNALRVTGFGTGTGGVGTYTLSGNALTGLGTLINSPNNHIGDGYTVNGTLTCNSQTVSTDAYSIGIGDESFTQGFGQITNTWNYADLGSMGTGKNIWAQRGNATAFTGSISGATLTLHGAANSTTVGAQGSGYTTASVAYGPGCVTTPVGTPNISAGKIVSITQTTHGADCTSVPGATISGDGAGATAATNVTFFTGSALIIGDLVIGSGVLASTVITGGADPTWTVTNSQSVGSTSMTATTTWCRFPTIWGNNVDMSGLYDSAHMNSFQIAISGNQC